MEYTDEQIKMFDSKEEYYQYIIKRQEAKIEQWKQEANRYQNLWCEAENDIQTAKFEAIKEYKSRVENDVITLLGKSNCAEFLEVLDYRYKEMVGESK